MKKLLTIFLTLSMLFSMAAPLSVLAAETPWHENITLAGPAKLDGDIAVLNAIEGTDASFTFPFKSTGNALDVQFSFECETPGTGLLLVVCTGKYRVYLTITGSNFRHRISSTQNTTYSFAPGNTKNTMRIIAKDNVGSIYVNGHLITDHATFENYPTSGTSAMASMGGGKWKVSDLIIRDFTGFSLGGSQAVTGGEAGEEETPAPTDIRYDFEEGEDLSAWKGLVVDGDPNVQDAQWASYDGVIGANHISGTKMSTTLDVVSGDDFVFEGKYRFRSYGDHGNVTLYYPGKFLDIYLRPQFVNNNTYGSVHYDDPFELNEWGIFRVESYNKAERARIYHDGQLIADWPMSSHSGITSSSITLVAKSVGTGLVMGGPNCFIEWDWVSYKPVFYSGFEIKSPLRTSEYIEGETITLMAKQTDPALGEVEKVDYMINGQLLASGYKKDGYKAEISGLPAGNYEVSADVDGKKGVVNRFSVKAPLNIDLNLERNQNGTVKAYLNSYDRFGDIAEVEYQLDGITVATATKAPYTVNIKGADSVGHTISAIYKRANGVKLGSIAKRAPEPKDQNAASTAYANEITYTVSGDSGSATVNLNNGTTQFSMTHTPNGVTYQTVDGEKSFDLGTGRFTVFTDGSFAEVYRNGQLAFAYLMPYTSDVSRSVKQNGMSVQDFTVVAPEERMTRFVKKNVKDNNATYQLVGNDTYYNLDFVADEKDAFTLAVNDGVYHQSITLEDGAFTAWNAHASQSIPYRVEIAKASEGKHLYRLESSAGMVNFYIDGKWAYSFRSLKAVGDSALGIDVKKGEIDYLAVNDWRDLYIHEDDFASTGEFETDEFWQGSQGSQTFTAADFYQDKGAESFVVNGLGKQNAITEMNVSVGNADVSADIQIAKDGDGFWFVANHGVPYTFTKVGYNFKTKKFEIVDSTEKGSSVSVAEADGTFPVGRYVHLEMKIRERAGGKLIVLYADGKEVVRKEDSYNSRGHIGFIASNSAANVKNFKYRGDGKPLAGMTTVLGAQNRTLDFYSTEEWDILGLSSGNRTNDDGRTWQTFSNAGATAAGVGSTTVCRLQNGELLALNTKATGMVEEETGTKLSDACIFVSADDGETWKDLGFVRKDEMETTPFIGRNTSCALTQGPSGRVYYAGGGAYDHYASGENFGAHEIWYSDDNGRSWKRSETRINYDTLGGFTAQESKVIETEYNTRLYMRTDEGMARYIESYDHGVTWDVANSKPLPMFSALNELGVGTDPNDPNIVYIGWSRDNKNASEDRDQFPRTNLSAARSLDGGYTWEYLGTYAENNSHKNNQMNAGMNVADGFAVIESYWTIKHGAEGNYTTGIFVQRKDWMKPTYRFEAVRLMRVSDPYSKMSAVMTDKVQRTLAIYPEDGTALIGGNRAENIVIENGILAEVAASFVGAKVKVVGDTVTLTCGDTETIFQGGEVVKKNGKTYVTVDAFAEKFEMTVHEKDGVKVISPYPTWSVRQMEAWKNALDLI